jgi:hypothetical protein
LRIYTTNADRAGELGCCLDALWYERDTQHSLLDSLGVDRHVVIGAAPEHMTNYNRVLSTSNSRL